MFDTGDLNIPYIRVWYWWFEYSIYQCLILVIWIFCISVFDTDDLNIPYISVWYWWFEYSLYQCLILVIWIFLYQCLILVIWLFCESVWYWWFEYSIYQCLIVVIWIFRILLLVFDTGDLNILYISVSSWCRRFDHSFLLFIAGFAFYGIGFCLWSGDQVFCSNLR